MIKIETGIHCRSVYASNGSFEWMLSIRKVDGSEVGEIAKFHCEEISSEYLRNYLNGWEQIEWEKLNTSDFFPKELKAVCGNYNIHIIIPRRNSKPDDKIMSEFKEFMVS